MYLYRLSPFLPSQALGKVYTFTHYVATKSVKIEIIKDDVVTISTFDELFLEHKKEDYTTVSVFDELSIEHKKGDHVAAKIFDDLSFEHKKGSQPEVSLFGGEASITHKKGNSTVIKAFDSEITLKKGQVTIKTSSMITHDVPTYKFTGNTSVGKVTPKGTGVYCAIPVCPYSGLPQTG